MATKLHAPRTGPGFSAGKQPPAVSPGITAHPKASDGNKSGTDRTGDDKRAPNESSGNWPGGNMAMMRKNSYG